MSDEYCKELVMSGFHQKRCKNRNKSDGYCGIHHPDALKKRQAKSKLAYDIREKNSPRGKLKVANKDLAEFVAIGKDLMYAHKLSNVDWEAMRKLEKLLAKYEE